MKTIVYYLSGTGNSFYAARQLAKILKCDIQPISKFKKTSHRKVGLFWPTHMMSAPMLVRNVAKQIDAEYVFSFNTCGFSSGIGHRQIEMALKGKLSTAFSVRMPDGSKNRESMDKLMQEADEYIKKSAQIVKNELALKGGKENILLYYLLNPLSTLMMKAMLPKISQVIKITEKCDGCGDCVKFCPAKNIKLVNKKAVRGKSCEMCTACVQWCKRGAVTMDDNAARYTNPKVKLKELQNP